MNTSIHARMTYWAIPNCGPTHCTQAQMPTWQQQHYRFSLPTPPTHPPRRRRRIITGRRRLLPPLRRRHALSFYVVVATAA